MRRGITMSMAAGAGAVALALVVALAGPAQAKGIESATIAVPGLDEPIAVDHPDDSKLPALTGFWEVMPGQPAPPALTDNAPTKQLGPHYTITWRLTTDADEATEIRQDLYPDAEGGPLVHTAAGQSIFDGDTVNGWYRAPATLRDMLRFLGVPLGNATLPAASSATSPQEAPAPSSDSPPWPAVFIAATGALALAVVGGAVAVRRARRRERVAPVPL
jgi:MYXO-CTERM domain-containing protein